MIPKAQAREQEILMMASNIFAVRDYHEVTMDEIAKRCDVGKGTLYRYYKSKEDLYTSILTKGLEALYSYLDHEVGKEQDVLGRIRRALYCTLNFFDQNKPFVKVFIKEEVQMREEENHPAILMLQKITKIFAGLLMDGQQEELIKKIDILLLQAMLTGMLKAFFLSSLDLLEKITVRERADILFELFLRGALVQAGCPKTKQKEDKDGV